MVLCYEFSCLVAAFYHHILSPELMSACERHLKGEDSGERTVCRSCAYELHQYETYYKEGIILTGDVKNV